MVNLMSKTVDILRQKATDWTRIECKNICCCLLRLAGDSQVQDARHFNTPSKNKERVKDRQLLTKRDQNQPCLRPKLAIRFGGKIEKKRAQNCQRMAKNN